MTFSTPSILGATRPPVPFATGPVRPGVAIGGGLSRTAPIDGGASLPLPTKPVIRTLPIATSHGGETTTGGSKGGVSQGGAAPTSAKTGTGSAPATPSTGSGTTNSGGAALAGNGPLIDALTGALSGGGMENPLDAASSPSTAALEALQPTSAQTSATSNPALLIAVLGAAAIGVVYVMAHRKKKAENPAGAGHGA